MDQLLMLPVVIGSGAAFGVLASRVLAAIARRQEPVSPPSEPAPPRRLDSVLAPYNAPALAGQ